jgi:hypothetical protein
LQIIGKGGILYSERTGRYFLRGKIAMKKDTVIISLIVFVFGLFINGIWFVRPVRPKEPYGLERQHLLSFTGCTVQDESRLKRNSFRKYEPDYLISRCQKISEIRFSDSSRAKRA